MRYSKNIAIFWKIFDKLHQKIKYMHLDFRDFYSANSYGLNIDIALLAGFDIGIGNSIINDFHTENFINFFERPNDA